MNGRPKYSTTISFFDVQKFWLRTHSRTFIYHTAQTFNLIIFPLHDYQELEQRRRMKLLADKIYSSLPRCRRLVLYAIKADIKLAISFEGIFAPFKISIWFHGTRKIHRSHQIFDTRHRFTAPPTRFRCSKISNRFNLRLSKFTALMIQYQNDHHFVWL